MSDDIAADTDHVEKLLLAIANEEDRLYCLREYIFDEVPKDYWDRLVVHFGSAHEAKPRLVSDGLTSALEQLETAGTSDADLRSLLTDLAKVVGSPGRRTAVAGKGKGSGTADTPLDAAVSAESARRSHAKRRRKTS